MSKTNEEYKHYFSILTILMNCEDTFSVVLTFLTPPDAPSTTDLAVTKQTAYSFLSGLMSRGSIIFENRAKPYSVETKQHSG